MTDRHPAWRRLQRLQRRLDEAQAVSEAGRTDRFAELLDPAALEAIEDPPELVARYLEALRLTWNER